MNLFKGGCLLYPILPLLLLTGCTTSRDAPNIIFILADDMGYGDPQCYNSNSKIPTPNIDKLARQGMLFTDAHTPSSVCTPTRYGLLTGRYCWRTDLKSGVLDGFAPNLIEKDRMTLASLLKKKGYNTACIGKWHLGMQWTDKNGNLVPGRPNHSGTFRAGDNIDFSVPVSDGPNDAGFDYFFGISASLDMSPYCFMENTRTAGIPDIPTLADNSLFMNQVPGLTTEDFSLEGVMPAFLSKAMDYIFAQGHASGNPFFLYLPLSAPHLPIVPSEMYLGKSEAGKYGDFVTEVDDFVGKIMDSLEETGQKDNTIIFFSSDNGGLWHYWNNQETGNNACIVTERAKYLKTYGHQSNKDWRGTKADIWEGGHRVPFIACWPGRIKAGSVSKQLICLTDMVATFAAIVDKQLPDNAGEDSYNMLPALLGKSRLPLRESLVSHSLSGMFSIRRGEWKLILGKGSGGFSQPLHPELLKKEPEGQLYNLKDDPSENINLYLDKPEIVDQLMALLEIYKTNGRSR
jgi:arylsulfatase A